MRTPLVLLCALASTALLARAQADSTSQPAPATPSAAAKVDLPPVAETLPEQAPATPPNAAPASSAPVPASSSATPENPQPSPSPAVNPAPVPPKTDQVPAASTKKSPDAKDAAAPMPYIIGPLDVLVIKIWNLDKLSGAYAVGADGMLCMPLVGCMKADGQSTKQVTEVLTQHVRNCCLNNPEGLVDVELGKNNSKRFYVYGGVGRQGEYPLDRSDLTVMDALASVGGFSGFANRKKIYILRGAKKLYFNYNDALQGKRPEQNIVIQNGDRIVVPE